MKLRLILFGASGMVGGSVLPSFLADPDVEAVLVVGRHPCGQSHAKLRELLLPDLKDFSGAQEQLKGYNACVFTLGSSSLGKSEAEFAAVNYELPLAAGRALSALNPDLAFVYVSGEGTDAQSKRMWSRVKGRTEQELMALPFRATGMIRLAALIPPEGVKSKTGWYQLFYVLMRPFMSLLKRLMPGMVLTAPELGRAMLKAAKGEAGGSILSAKRLAELGRA